MKATSRKREAYKPHLRIPLVMSATEIIAELSKLDRHDLELVNARVDALLQSKQQGNSPQKRIGQVLLEFAGTAKGLPSDYSANHDHYLYGVPKRQP